MMFGPTFNPFFFFQPPRDWTPVVTPIAPMTITGVAIIYARFAILGNLVFVQFNITGTLGGTLTNRVDVSAPVAMAILPNSGNGVCVLTYNNVAGPLVGRASFIPSASTFNCLKLDSSNFVAGAIQFVLQGFYQT